MVRIAPLGGTPQRPWAQSFHSVRPYKPAPPLGWEERRRVGVGRDSTLRRKVLRSVRELSFVICPLALAYLDFTQIAAGPSDGTLVHHGPVCSWE